MQFHGGKEKIAKDLVRVISAFRGNRSRILAPFMGGASVESRVKDLFSVRDFGDLDQDLVTLWTAARDGWDPPCSLPKEEYYRLKTEGSSALRGFAAYGLSFGGKRWGGYAHNARGDDFCGAARRGVLQKAQGLAGSNIECRSYDTWNVDENTLVYADPPYAGTTGYSGTGQWDAPKFWRAMKRWAAQGALVLVSEYVAPPDWKSVWVREKKVTMRKDDNRAMAQEHLFTC